MTIRVSVTHHEPDSAAALVAEVFHVGPGGEVSSAPVRSTDIAPGVTATMHLHLGNVLVVREADGGAC